MMTEFNLVFFPQIYSILISSIIFLTCHLHHCSFCALGFLIFWIVTFLYYKRIKRKEINWIDHSQDILRYFSISIISFLLAILSGHIFFIAKRAKIWVGGLCPEFFRLEAFFLLFCYKRMQYFNWIVYVAVAFVAIWLQEKQNSLILFVRLYFY